MMGNLAGQELGGTSQGPGHSRLSVFTRNDGSVYEASTTGDALCPLHINSVYTHDILWGSHS